MARFLRFRLPLNLIDFVLLTCLFAAVNWSENVEATTLSAFRRPPSVLPVRYAKARDTRYQSLTVHYASSGQCLHSFDEISIILTKVRFLAQSDVSTVSFESGLQ